MANLNDEELMLLVQSGDLDKMRLLFDRYQVRIYNYCLRLSGDRKASKDLCQEAFYKALRFRHTYRATSFNTWLYAIARNLCYDHLKHQRRSVKQLAEFSALYAPTVGPTEVLPTETDPLDLALRQLKVADRELIVMHKYQGMKYREIAEVTNSTVGAVRTKTHRALLQLKQLYFTNLKKYEL